MRAGPECSNCPPRPPSWAARQAAKARGGSTAPWTAAPSGAPHFPLSYKGQSTRVTPSDRVTPVFDCRGIISLRRFANRKPEFLT
eukprot:297794-Prymnesium_polylepis.1